MRTFVSTRGTGSVSFAEALFGGLAPDGGLYVPEEVPRLPAPPAFLAGEGFPALARWAAPRLFEGAAAPDVLAEVVGRALDFPVSLVELEPGLRVLELFHGPTLAFKDVGARFMACMMSALDREAGHRRTVLVATSGDTGSAVAHAFRGLERTRVVVLFPRDGVSQRQRRQMTTLGGNVTAVAVEGAFDDCQRLVKGAFSDAALAAEAGLTSANSINVGRLLPQTLYYVHAQASIGWDRPAAFVVPSGNLGNLTGGLLGLRAGMPVAGFVAASNVNRVFPDYLESGVVETRPSVRTVSNAMDVGAPSNLERVRWLYGGDVEALRRDVRGAWADDLETRAAIREVHRRYGYLLDPHGAVGWAAHRKVPADAGIPVVLLATAHPAKFPEVVEEAVGAAVDVPERLAERLDAPEAMEHIAPDPAALRNLVLEHVRA
ncbi:MAG TPA: threonine synthase [Longimicrobiales bacterium]|nr:threonine synthase [Longimicrobiales bacterium]